MTDTNASAAVKVHMAVDTLGNLILVVDNDFTRECLMAGIGNSIEWRYAISRVLIVAHPNTCKAYGLNLSIATPDLTTNYAPANH